MSDFKQSFSILQLDSEIASERQVGVNDDNPLLRTGSLHFLPVEQHPPGRLLQAEEPDGGDVDTERVFERSLSGKNCVGVLERDLSVRRWVERNTVIYVKRTSGLVVSADGHEDLKVILAQGGCRHSTGGPKREDRSSTDVDRYLGEVDIIKGDIMALTFDLVISLEVVEGLLRKVCSDGSRVLLGDGRNKDGITEEELEIDAVCSLVLGEHMPEGVQNRRTVEVGLVEGSREVIQEPVSGRERDGR